MRLIDADALVKKVVETLCSTSSSIKWRGMRKIADVIEAAPIIEPKCGEWLDSAGDFSTAECDQCEAIYEVSPEEKPCKKYFNAFRQSYKFCPNCGADMRKGE